MIGDRLRAPLSYTNRHRNTIQDIPDDSGILHAIGALLLGQNDTVSKNIRREMFDVIRQYKVTPPDGSMSLSRVQ
jgi:hypothetical protein